jgi:CTP:molybdopterin cytidylyltransferase MocA
VGAKSVVRQHAARGVTVRVEDEGAFEDIDTPEDYERVFSRKLDLLTEG